MSFYDIHKLKQKSDTTPPPGISFAEMHQLYCGVLTPLPIEICGKYVGSNYDSITSSVEVKMYENNTRAIIKFNIKAFEKTTRYPINYQLGEITISTINNNCGAIHISNLQSEHDKIGIGSHILKEAINFAEEAGYSMIIGNTAGDYQHRQLAYFWYKNGFIPLKEFCYINKRSDNANIWFIKYLSYVQEINYEQALNHDKAKENYYEDEEEDY